MSTLIETVVARILELEYVPPEYECRMVTYCQPDPPDPPDPSDPPDDPSDPGQPAPCMKWIRICGTDQNGDYGCTVIFVPCDTEVVT